MKKLSRNCKICKNLWLEFCLPNEQIQPQSYPNHSPNHSPFLKGNPQIPFKNVSRRFDNLKNFKKYTKNARQLKMQHFRLKCWINFEKNFWNVRNWKNIRNILNYSKNSTSDSNCNFVWQTKPIQPQSRESFAVFERKSSNSIQKLNQSAKKQGKCWASPPPLTNNRIAEQLEIVA